MDNSYKFKKTVYITLKDTTFNFKETVHSHLKDDHTTLEREFTQF